MTTKFYDIEPGDGSYYVCENGQRIARFDELQKAEELRAALLAPQIEAAEHE